MGGLLPLLTVPSRLWRFFLVEWLLSISIVGTVALSLCLERLPQYRPQQLVPIFLLWVLFVAVRGLEQSGFLRSVAQRMERGRLLAPKMVVLAFVLSMLMSIDVALVVILPVVLALHIPGKPLLALLVSFVTHAGGALTPFGTPQNIFIFSFYQLQPVEFVAEIAPFSLPLFAILLAMAFLVPVGDERVEPVAPPPKTDTFHGIAFFLLLLVGILMVLRLVPWPVGGAILLVAFILQPNSLRIDYPLLVTFVLFIGLANLAGPILARTFTHHAHPFLLTSLLAQFLGNVPATLLLHTAVPDWRPLLWGANVGGFGSPVAALANLLAYRIYAARMPDDRGPFLLRMTGWGLVLFGIGFGLYFLVLSGVFTGA